MSNNFKLGKTPARNNSVLLKMRDYVTRSKLPNPPTNFGHENLIGSNWQTLGNTSYGDCVWAGAGHETMMWNKEANTDVQFTDESVLSDYSAVTGFNPNDSSTDCGTDVQVAANYRKNTGVLDANGKRHKVAAYLAITPGNLDEHFVAMYLFGAVGIGVEFPESAMQQFQSGQPWDVVKGSEIAGGHYLPLVARRNNILCVSWGKLQSMTPKFLNYYEDEAVAYVSLETLNAGKTLEGFNADQLIADLAQL
jgi:hypothetical protein